MDGWGYFMCPTRGGRSPEIPKVHASTPPPINIEPGGLSRVYSTLNVMNYAEYYIIFEKNMIRYTLYGTCSSFLHQEGQNTGE